MKRRERSVRCHGLGAGANGQRVKERERERHRGKWSGVKWTPWFFTYLPASKVNLVGSDPYLRRAVNGHAQSFSLELVTSQR